MADKIIRHIHNDGNTGFVVSTQQSISRSGDDILAFFFFEIRMFTGFNYL